MKDKRPKGFKLVKIHPVLDFLKNDTVSSSIWECIIFDNIQGINRVLTAT